MRPKREGRFRVLWCVFVAASSPLQPSSLHFPADAAFHSFLPSSSMAASSDTPAQPSPAQKDALPKKTHFFTKDSNRKLSKKAKESANGVQQRAGNDAGVNTGAPLDQGEVATSPSTSEAGKCMCDP